VSEQIPILGTKMFCPDCRRILVDVRPDGRALIYGKTTMRGLMQGLYTEGGDMLPPDDCVIVEAFCQRRPCRLRRWLHRKGR
jgi:hypothetical protein